MINYATVSNKIFKVLKGHGYRVKLYTEEGIDTIDPDEARWFFVKEPNMMVLLSDKNQEIVLNKNSTVPLSAYEQALKQIKNIASHYILDFTTHNFGTVVEPKSFSHIAKKQKKENAKMDSIAESSFSKMRGSLKTSVQALEGVKVIVKHKKPVDEAIRGARSRQIKQIFIENGGERTEFPYKSLSGARAMARHIQCGGSFTDNVGGHISRVTEELVKLSEFYNQIKKQNLINESTADVVSLIKEHISSSISELKAFSGSKTYHTAKSMMSEQEYIVEQGDEVSQLRDMFTIKQFNEQFEGVMQILNTVVNMNKQQLIRIQEAASQPIACDRPPISEDAVMEYASKSAKIGNQLMSLSNVIIDNKELVEFLVKVGKKLISEAKLSDFETQIVRSVMENVYVEKKVQQDTKDLVESYVNKLNLSLSKFEYPHLMKLSEAGGKFIMKTSMDTNGNKILIVGTPISGAMSIQTNDNLPLIHNRADLNSDEALDEVEQYVRNQGSTRQKGVWREYMRYINNKRLSGQNSGNDDVVVENDGDIIGSFIREFKCDEWGVSSESMSRLSECYNHGNSDLMRELFVEAITQASKNGQYLDFNDDNNLVVVNDFISEDETNVSTEELISGFRDIAAKIKDVYAKYKNLVATGSGSNPAINVGESAINEWKYRGSSIDLSDSILQKIKQEIDTLVLQYQAAIKNLKWYNKIKQEPASIENIGQANMDTFGRRIFMTKNKIWGRLAKLDRMINTIER